MYACLDSAELSQKKLSEWNPMERDYLAQRNNYEIDDEAAGLALHGYGESVHAYSNRCELVHSQRVTIDLVASTSLRQAVFGENCVRIYTSRRVSSICVCCCFC